MSMDAPGNAATASDLVAAGDPMQPAINRLLNEPGRFGFFQAVRLLCLRSGARIRRPLRARRRWI